MRVSACRASRVAPALLVTALLALAAGCASTPSAERPQRPAEAAANARAENQRAAQKAAVAADPAAESSAPDDVSERRRRDYPEIETNPSGFTITEQIRIAGDVRAEYDRALQLLEQSRFDEGIALLREITEMAPDVTAPFIDLGVAYSRSGDLQQAEKALLAALRLSPDNPIAHNELGIVYRKLGRFAEARASYEKALAVYPGFHFANRNLAVLCDLYLGDLDCALQHYQAYMRSVVEDQEVTIWLADIRNRLGQ